MNAAGRLEHAARALELVMTTDESRALAIAEELEVLNRQRRSDQDTVFAAAMAMAEQYADDPVLVLADTGWSHGIVGIVASKLVERWGKPVLVAQVLGDHTKGSARSLGSFNMIEALRANTDIFVKFGGHFYAAGYTLPTERLDELRAGLCEYYRTSQSSSEMAVVPVDVRLTDLADIDWTLHDTLKLLEPFGAAHPQPVFELTGVTLAELKAIGQDRSHLRLVLTDASGRRLAGIGFGLASRHGHLKPGQPVTVLGSLNKNEFRGARTLQLVITDLRYE
jgi:single-stranded-DNA-specific exonuclease